MSDSQTYRFVADEVARVCEGQVLSGFPGQVFVGLTIDSRKVEKNDLFVAIRGNRYDGHGFVGDAIRRGAVGVIVSERSVASQKSNMFRETVIILVRDTTKSLQAIARHVRQQSGTKVVAITGSVGKTTTKELAASFIGARHTVERNVGNLNNHIGLPLSLLALKNRPEVAVVELGMNHAGEIRNLVGIAEPNVRVWTNVADVHAEFFSSRDAIADAKAEILLGAGKEDHLVVNADDSFVMSRVGDFPGSITTFGVGMQADVRATAVQDDGVNGVGADVDTPVGRATFHSQLIGVGNIANVVAAISVALRFQVPLDAILEVLERFKPLPRRGSVHRLSGGVTVVDDSYNSNPEALRLALQSVGASQGYHRRVAVLGEMLELGDQAFESHRSSGSLAVQAGFDCVATVGGADGDALADGALAAGLTERAVLKFSTSEEATEVLAKFIQPGDLVLVKGSRGIQTDLIVDKLRAEWD